ncbi:peptidase G2 autoproteolytic cleavage domain-containing protein [Staphylococcus haemolyticus]|uniref:peptidase G2 autoproteolytic cleavage domain-containing protein n=1 Tax=Staphylococcus haemolyticus TaxID=1283 RepID=UPI000D1F687A|nr:peptidase G2 autoproteolytic cleavage domain-containing protein [Staphylococcus haemolyticus]PTK57443.1 peptidase G2 [Staphylococcus haemolyticus]PTK69796.1 peptidase G2 [Staphylococcus haemolyticus]PTK69855.1 peptidase G2 [Staphylococcus haemolyticus]
MLSELKTKLHSLFGSDFISQVERNFETIKLWADKKDNEYQNHVTSQKNAHKSSQIKHTIKSGQDVNLQDHERYQDEQITNLVLGHNGDGVQELRASRTSMDAQNFDDLSNRLYHDFLRENNEREKLRAELLKKIQRIVNVDDFGGDPTGQKDSTKAFQDALGTGNVLVTMSAGTYLTTGIKMPNNSRLVGQGKDITTIKFMDSTPAENIGITNLKMSGNAQNISLENFTFDGNKFRQDKKLKPTGGSRSSNIRFAGVTNGYIYNVKSHSALLHCIDTTYASDDYYYEGDGNRVPYSLESKHIHIDNCEVYGCGDDGITTHHSRYITISNCYAHDPTISGGNNNGIEIDDGSQFVFLSDNKTYRNYGGLEIKAHAPASASRCVFVNNHLSIEDTRAYNIRHIGHHRAKTDAKSKTAYDVSLNNCVALRPKYNGVYPGTTPRALLISAYKNVSVNNFTAIGDSDFSKLEDGKTDSNLPAIAVQFMSENVILNNITVTGFTTAGQDIKFFGGDNRGERFILSNVNIYNSSPKVGIASGGGIYDLKIINGNLKGRGTGNGIETYNNTTMISGITADNYSNAAVIANEKYKTVPTVLKGGLSAGSTGSAAVDPRSVVLATTGNSRAYSPRSFVLGSGMSSKAYGSRSGVINSLSSETSKESHTQTVFNSRNVKSPGSYRVVAGYSGTGSPSTSNIKVDLNTLQGNLNLAGKLTQNNADIAELFESQSGQPIELGTIVTLDGDKIRKAQPNDEPIGVISGTAALVANDKTYHHKDRYLQNEYGMTLTKRVQREFEDVDGNSVFEWRDEPIENPNYNEDLPYVSRSERPEWNTVGLIGQIYTNVEKDVIAGDLINGKAGIGYKDNVNGKGRVMAITTPYNEERGFAIALVLWGVK